METIFPFRSTEIQSSSRPQTSITKLREPNAMATSPHISLKRMLGIPLAITMLATILLAAVDAKPAGAVTCWGDWCSGKDPAATGCDADAYTAASSRVPGTYFHVELRWSPTCGTGWARVPASWGNSYPDRFRVQQDTGYVQVGRVNSNTNYAWTRMIYSRVPCIRAQWTGAPGFASTAWFC